jgi:hypothetical protein
MGTCSSLHAVTLSSNQSFHLKENLTSRISISEDDNNNDNDDDDKISYYSTLEEEYNIPVTNSRVLNELSYDGDDAMSYHSVSSNHNNDNNSSNELKEQKLEEFQKLFPDSSKMDLLAFLKFRDYNLEEAELQYRNTLAFRKNAPKPTIIDVAPFMMVSINNIDNLLPLFI